MNSKPLLEVKNLQVATIEKDPSFILQGINFKVHSGETLAIVGESGSGKSMTALSLMGLLPEHSVKVTAGEIQLGDRNLTSLSDKEMNQIRGKEISMIFQEPMTSLNPSFTIGNQIAEVFQAHTHYSSKEIKELSANLLAQVKIPDPVEKLQVYPHELSGGMRQRVMIAMALACNPKILIADEPTTALDVTIQAQILDLLAELQSNNGMTVILITHDLGVVTEVCKRAVVMYAGQIVEEGPVDQLFRSPKHPYTHGLLSSMPKLGRQKQKLHMIKGVVPDARSMPKGCRFHPRCEWVSEKCQTQEPPLHNFESERRIKCWHHL